MDWVFDNLNLLLVIAGTIAYWLTQRREARKQTAGEPEPGDLLPPSSPETGDRTVATPGPITSPDELRRRILEQLGIPSPEPVPPPLPAVSWEAPPPLPEPRPEPAAASAKSPAPVAKAPVTRPTTRVAGLRTSLRSPGSLREAVVLREVLGPPVGLR